MAPQNYSWRLCAGIGLLVWAAGLQVSTISTTTAVIKHQGCNIDDKLLRRCICIDCKSVQNSRRSSERRALGKDRNGRPRRSGVLKHDSEGVCMAFQFLHDL